MNGFYAFKVTGVNTTTTTKTVNAAIVVVNAAAAEAEEGADEGPSSGGGEGGEGGGEGKKDRGEVGRAAVYMEIESGREVVLEIVVETKNQETYDSFRIHVEGVYEF